MTWQIFENLVKFPQSSASRPNIEFGWCFLHFAYKFPRFAKFYHRHSFVSQSRSRWPIGICEKGTLGCFLMLLITHIIQDLGMSAVYVLEDVVLSFEELTANLALKFLLIHLQDLLVCNLAICSYRWHFENGTKAGRRHRLHH